MGLSVRLEYGTCPTCGAEAFIESTSSVDSRRSEARERVTFLECSSEQCLHYPAVLQYF